MDFYISQAFKKLLYKAALNGLVGKTLKKKKNVAKTFFHACRCKFLIQMTRMELHSEFDVFLPVQLELEIVSDKITTDEVDIPAPSNSKFPFIPI